MDHRVNLTFRMLYEGDGRRMNGGRSIGEPIEHDVHDALVRMSASDFSYVVRRVLSGARRFDDVVVASGIPDAYLVGSECSSYEAWIEEAQFVAYLDGLGLTLRQAVTMTEDDMDAVRCRAGAEMAQAYGHAL